VQVQAAGGDKALSRSK